MYTQFKKANDGQKWITAGQRDFAHKNKIKIDILTRSRLARI